jgi:hypothetical protein
MCSFWTVEQQDDCAKNNETLDLWLMEFCMGTIS